MARFKINILYAWLGILFAMCSFNFGELVQSLASSQQIIHLYDLIGMLDL